MKSTHPLEAAFREAIASGEYLAARVIWESYAPAASLADVRRLIEWTRRSALASQALAAAEIAALEIQHRYAGPRQPAHPTVRILA